MKAAYSIFTQHFKKGFRDKYELFWAFLFPLILMSILTLIFSNLTGQPSIKFDIGFVDLDTEASSIPEMDGTFSGMLQDVFVQISEEENSWVNLSLPGEDETGQEFIDSRLNSLEKGAGHGLIVIPEGFNERIMEIIISQYMPGVGDRADMDPADIIIYSRPHSDSSKAAVSAIEQMLFEMNREIGVETKLVNPEYLINPKTTTVNPEGDSGLEFSFANYIMPGIILMAILTMGLSVIVESLLSLRDKGILRRYFVTPISTTSYFGGLLMYVVLISIFQVLLVYAFGRGVFGAEIALFSPKPILFVIFSIVVVLSLGFFISSVAKSANSASMFMNILIYPMMFLGELFFPIENVPIFMRAFIVINPLTYLAAGLRDALGVYTSFYPLWAIYLVPSLWFLISIIYSIKYFRWEVQ